MYFFERWVGYAHPVEPVGPLKFDEVLDRDGFCLAWMAQSEGADKFVLFETISQEREMTSLVIPAASDGRIFEALRSDDKISAGNAMDPVRWLASEAYILVDKEDRKKVLLVKKQTSIYYKYRYSSEGLLRNVEIKNIDGEIKNLDYTRSE